MASNRRNQYDNSAKRGFWERVTKFCSRCCDHFIKTAQPKVRLKKTCDRRKQMIVMYGLTVYLRFTFVSTFACQDEHFTVPMRTKMNRSSSSTQDQWTFCRRQNVTYSSTESTQSYKRLKKARSLIQRATRSGIGTNTFEPSAMIRRSAISAMKISLQAIETN